MDDIVTYQHKKGASELKSLYATYKESEDLINIGAYVKGSNHKVDYSISMIEQIKDYIKQDVMEESEFDDAVKKLTNLFAKNI